MVDRQSKFFIDDLKPGDREQSWPSAFFYAKIIMNTKLYVGNLSYNVTENDLKDLFSPHGAVTEINVVIDRVTNKPRGFAFVTLASKEEADAAVQALNGTECGGRTLTVNEARPREERNTYSGGGGGGRTPRY